MKAFVFAILLIFVVSTFAANTLRSTDITEVKAPTIEQLEKAREVLAEAIEAKKAGKEAVYKAKILEASEYQKFKNITKNVHAAFIAKNYRGQKVNYFDDEANEEIRYNIMIDETCYVGSIKNALEVLNYFATKTDFINYDEEWFDNARIKHGVLLIDHVDGPNEYTEIKTVPKCN